MSVNWDILAQVVTAEMNRWDWSIREIIRQSGLPRTTMLRVLRDGPYKTAASDQLDQPLDE